VGAELFHVDKWKDGRTNMAKLIVACHNFANAPDNQNLYNQKTSRNHQVNIVEE